LWVGNCEKCMKYGDFLLGINFIKKTYRLT
jgi:hypothetical protein